MLIITSSLRPTRRIRAFCNDLSKAIPNSIKISRGKLSLEELAEKALELNADRVILVGRWKGDPGKIELFKVGTRGLESHPPVLYLTGVKLQTEYGRRQASFREVVAIASSDLSSQALKIAKSLSEFLNLPLLPPNAGTLKAEAVMLFSSHPQHLVEATFLLPTFNEVGPSFIVKNAVWSSGETQ